MAEDNSAMKAIKAKPLKALPTSRLTFEKQLSIIRAYAAASTNERKLVSNADVGKIAEVDPNSVSLCNPFLREIQLIVREGHNHRPSDAAVDYFQAWKWNQETAAIKLRPVIESSWFANVLSPRLDFRAMSKSEAMQALAEEIKAPKEFEGNLALLLDYLKVAGVINMENGAISIGKKEDEVLTKLPPIVDADLSKPKGVVHDEELNPFILGLLKKLPPPETDWSIAGRIKWLQTAANIFGLIYTETGGNEIEYIAIEKKQL